MATFHEMNAPFFGFQAIGHPRPQGSKRHVGRGILIDPANLKPWRDTVTAAAMEAKQEHGWKCETGPVTVGLSFVFARPASHYGTGKNARKVKPSAPEYPSARSVGDLDKLIRSVFDALTMAAVIRDDSLVVRIPIAHKAYGDFGEPEHASITIQAIGRDRANQPAPYTEEAS